MRQYKKEVITAMKYLEYEVRNLAITKNKQDKASPISGAVNYFGIHFDFDEEFANLPGTKAAEFFKGRTPIRVDLVEGKCGIPNEFLQDSTPFDMRVLCGGLVATPWVSVSVTASGPITPETPEEDAPTGLEYVKTESGDKAIPYMRMGPNGPEFSQNGVDYEGSVSGIPDVPKDKRGEPQKKYMRVNGDWVEYVEPEGGAGGLTGAATALTAIDTTGEVTTASLAAELNKVIALLQTRGIALSE